MKMKAAQIIDKKTLEIIDFDKPESVEGRPIIKVAYAGVCGSDLHYWANGDFRASASVTFPPAAFAIGVLRHI